MLYIFERKMIVKIVIVEMIVFLLYLYNNLHTIVLLLFKNVKSVQNHCQQREEL